MERANTSMSIIDIGILTGFKPEQKSLQKVTVTMIAILSPKDKVL